MMSKKWTAAVFAVLATLLTCSEDKKEVSDILPIRASLSIMGATGTDPVVFLQPSAADLSSDDDFVMVDVMLRSTSIQTFDVFNLIVRFDPGLVQIGQVDYSSTPLGSCNSSDPCAPRCLNNAASPSPNANVTGELFIGVPANALGCSPVSVSGTVKLLTLGFIAAAAGTSTLELVDGPGNGDCEILLMPSPLPILCNDGIVKVIASR